MLVMRFLWQTERRKTERIMPVSAGSWCGYWGGRRDRVRRMDWCGRVVLYRIDQLRQLNRFHTHPHNTAFLDRVDFETVPAPLDGNDVFELETAPDGGGGGGAAAVVTIRGSSPLALATGLGWYLRYYCKAFPGSWDNRVVDGRPTGRQLETVDPERLPGVVPMLRRHAAVRWRYYMNVCTVSYSMVWWDWSRWEEELDWMAMSGINLALAFTGQELVWTQLFESYGMARKDLLDGWFTGPAFLAWQRMGNIQKWGGPLSFRGFVEAQHQLQLRILARMRLLGITPVLPAFAGFLPQAFVDRLPANVSVTR